MRREPIRQLQWVQRVPSLQYGQATAETGSTYRLEDAVATLNPHVGHKVQVTGALEAATASTSGSADPASAANAPRLRVESVKRRLAPDSDRSRSRRVDLTLHKRVDSAHPRKGLRCRASAVITSCTTSRSSRR
jgi:hypothetical protein